MSTLTSFLNAFTALFVVVNPIGAIPPYIYYSRHQTEPERKATLRTSVFAVASILLLSIFMGDGLLSFFGISLPSFRIGGGILMLYMAVSMLEGRPKSSRPSPEESDELDHKENIAVVPIATPILAGPGAISTTIILAHGAASVTDKSAIIAAVLAVALTTAIALYLAHPIADRLGRTGINIATRIEGLVLSAVAVEFIVGGLIQVFPLLSTGAH